MDDKELIEKAADAAGYEYFSSDDGESIYLVWELPNGEAGRKLWDPLEDDGDAFRLMDALEISCEWNFFRGAQGFVSACRGGQSGFVHETSDFEGESLSATRRAIVRAAAAMGDES